MDTAQLPKYKQVIETIKGKISKGEWPIGSKIPSQRKLAEEFGVNRSTIITALEELAADGLIEGKTGVGTKVINNTWTLLASRQSANWSEYIDTGIHRASEKIVQEINDLEMDPAFIQLSKGELSPEIFPVQTMQKVLKEAADELSELGYEEPKGYLPLRQAVSEYLAASGIDTSPSSILIVSGGLQALQLVSLGLVQRGAPVFLEKPSYLYSLQLFRSSGMNLKGLPMDKEGVITKSISLKKYEKGKSILYTIPSYHNPTGILMTEKRRRELLDVCRIEQLPIVEDDIYRELWLDEMPPPPLKAMDKNGQVLYMGSLSKTLSPGLRIGWVAAPEPVIDRLADLKMQTDYGSSSLSQRVAEKWLSTGLYQKHMESVREQLRIRRNTALNTLYAHLSGIAEWNSPEGGFFIWLKVPSSIPIRSLYRQAILRKLLINPGSIYSDGPNHFIRISYAYASLGELQEGIFILGEEIRKLL